MNFEQWKDDKFHTALATLAQSADPSDRSVVPRRPRAPSGQSAHALHRARPQSPGNEQAGSGVRFGAVVVRRSHFGWRALESLWSEALGTFTVCKYHKGGWWRILAKRTNFGIPNVINAVRFLCVTGAMTRGSLVARIERSEIRVSYAVLDVAALHPGYGLGKPRLL